MLQCQLAANESESGRIRNLSKQTKFVTKKSSFVRGSYQAINKRVMRLKGGSDLVTVDGFSSNGHLLQARDSVNSTGRC